MFSTFTSTNDSSALDDGTYMFDQSNDDLLSLPMSNDSIHLKDNIVPMSGLSNIGYDRQSATSSVHYGDSHDTSELSNGHMSGRDEREGSTPGTFIGAYGPDYTPSPLQYPFTPMSNTGNGLNGIENKSSSHVKNNILPKVSVEVTIPRNGAQPTLEEPQDNHAFVARTPQSLGRESQQSSSPEVVQSQERHSKDRRATTHSLKGKGTELRANSSIPADMSWPEFGRQCILAAENSRLNPFALHPAEFRLLREHINQAQVTIYLNIRNAILRLWHRNPLVYVSPEEAAGCARDKRYFGLANIAHLWLLRNGYINFGCVEVPDKTSTTSRNKSKGTQRTVVVVGAGMSGLGCARHLEGLFAQLGDEFANKGERPPKVIILEARPRVGGRVYSHPFLNQSGSTLPPGHRCTAEMGAQIVTGFEHGNPLNSIIRGQLGIPYHGLRDNTILYDHDGTVVERSHDHLVEKLYNDVLERASVYRNKPAPQRTVEGDRNFILFGREPSDIGGPSIAELDKSSDSLTTTIERGAPSTAEEKPTSGVEKLAGRAYQLSAGINTDITAAEAVQAMGWSLKTGSNTKQSVDLDAIAHASEFPTLGFTMDEALKQYQTFIDMKPRDMRLLNWHHANLEYANAVSVNQLSLSGWDQDMGNEFEGQHTEIIGGYQQVPRGLWQVPSKLDVRFNSPIKAVRYSTEERPVGKAVKIECKNGEVFEADKVILTTPLGVLKSGSIAFEPALPDWKQGVIERMGFGLLNKVILVYEKAFWEPDRDMFGLLNEAEQGASLRPEDYAAKRGRFYLFWNCLKTSGKPVLIALMAGDAAHYAEQTSNDQLVREVTDRLDSMFAPQPVPLPSETIVTRWRRDPFACGSYSYVGPKTQAGDYDVMARPHGPLHFAGEATCGTHPATVHGAYLSGLRAAAEVAEAVVGPIKVSSPLVEKKIKLEHSSSLSAADPKRKLESLVSPTQSSQKVRVQRDEDYEAAIIGAILEQIGERPVKPGRSGVNPFLLYTKDFWYMCKKECDELRKRATGNSEAKASKQEIRSAIGFKWRTASEEVKKPYLDQATNAREDATANAASFKDRVATWDQDAARIRQEYIQKYPPSSGNEDLILNSRTAIELGAGKRLRRL